MAFDRAQLEVVSQLAGEVQALADEVIEEGDHQTEWDVEARQFVVRARWPHGGTAKTGALRRRSMDLTRALAEMRKS